MKFPQNFRIFSLKFPAVVSVKFFYLNLFEFLLESLYIFFKNSSAVSAKCFLNFRFVLKNSSWNFRWVSTAFLYIIRKIPVEISKIEKKFHTIVTEIPRKFLLKILCQIYGNSPQNSSWNFREQCEKLKKIPQTFTAHRISVYFLPKFQLEIQKFLNQNITRKLSGNSSFNWKNSAETPRKLQLEFPWSLRRIFSRGNLKLYKICKLIICKNGF